MENEVIKIISRSSGLSLDMIRQKTQIRKVLKWRQLYYWSLKKFYAKSASEIAQDFGVSEATVLRGAASVEEKIKTDFRLMECFNELKKYHD